MKTRKNINRIAKMSFASLAVLTASAFSAMYAGNNNNTGSDKENKAAFDRLEVVMSAVEKSMKFDAGTYVVSEADFNLNNLDNETAAAIERLSKLNSLIEKQSRFEAPKVSDDVQAYEIRSAVERLEAVTSEVEKIVKYKAPVITEEIANYDLAAAVERLENHYLAVEQSMKFNVPVTGESNSQIAGVNTGLAIAAIF